MARTIVLQSEIALPKDPQEREEVAYQAGCAVARQIGKKPSPKRGGRCGGPGETSARATASSALQAHLPALQGRIPTDPALLRLRERLRLR